MGTAMNGSLDADLAKFIAHLRARLEVGAKTYGSTSFERPIAELVDEVMEEAVDICGWSFLAWLRLSRLRADVQRLEQLEGNDG